MIYQLAYDAFCVICQLISYCLNDPLNHTNRRLIDQKSVRQSGNGKEHLNIGWGEAKCTELVDKKFSFVGIVH